MLVPFLIVDSEIVAYSATETSSTADIIGTILVNRVPGGTITGIGSGIDGVGLDFTK